MGLAGGWRVFDRHEATIRRNPGEGEGREERKEKRVGEGTMARKVVFFASICYVTVLYLAQHKPFEAFCLKGEGFCILETQFKLGQALLGA